MILIYLRAGVIDQTKASHEGLEDATLIAGPGGPGMGGMDY